MDGGVGGRVWMGVLMLDGGGGYGMGFHDGQKSLITPFSLLIVSTTWSLNLHPLIHRILK